MNAAIHQKSLTTIVTSLTPILSSILSQDVSEGLFICTYPDEYAQCFLSYLTFLLDPGLFTWQKDVFVQKIKAIADIMENMLCSEKGSCLFLYDIYNKALNSNYPSS